MADLKSGMRVQVGENIINIIIGLIGNKTQRYHPKKKTKKRRRQRKCQKNELLYEVYFMEYTEYVAHSRRPHEVL